MCVDVVRMLCMHVYMWQCVYLYMYMCMCVHVYTIYVFKQGFNKINELNQIHDACKCIRFWSDQY